MTLYFNNASGNNWSTVANWFTDATFLIPNGAVPLATDDVVFVAGSGACIVDVASVAKTLDFTNYVNTLTKNATLTVSGNVALGAGMTVAGSSTLIINATATLTSNGKAWGRPLTLTGALTFTFADDWDYTDLTFGDNSPATIAGGRTHTIRGNLSKIGSNYVLAPGTTFLLAGTGTWSDVSGTGGGVGGNSGSALSITINTAGTITFHATNGPKVFRSNVTYTAGTVVTTNSTFSLTRDDNPVTLNLSGISLNNFSDLNNTGSRTVTLSSSMTTVGAVTFSSTTGTQTYNGFSIIFSGAVTMPALTSGAVAGTTVLSSRDGSSISMNASVTTGTLRLPITFAGNTTITGSIRYQTGTITYFSGTITLTGSTLVITASCTFNTPGLTWPAITVSATATITLTGALTVTTFIWSAAVIFAGTEGFTAATLTSTVAGLTHKLVSGETYAVTGSLTLTGSAGSPILLQSTTPDVTAAFNLTVGATRTVQYVNPTDINSSGGDRIRTYKGTIDNSANWQRVQTRFYTLPMAA